MIAQCADASHGRRMNRNGKRGHEQIGSGWPMLGTAPKAQRNGKNGKPVCCCAPRAVTFAAFRVKPQPSSRNGNVRADRAADKCTTGLAATVPHHAIPKHRWMPPLDGTRAVLTGVRVTALRGREQRAVRCPIATASRDAATHWHVELYRTHASVRWAIGRLITCRISPGCVGQPQADSRHLQLTCGGVRVPQPRVWRGLGVR